MIGAQLFVPLMVLVLLLRLLLRIVQYLLFPIVRASIGEGASVYVLASVVLRDEPHLGRPHKASPGHASWTARSADARPNLSRVDMRARAYRRVGALAGRQRGARSAHFGRTPSRIGGNDPNVVRAVRLAVLNCPGV